MVVRAVKLGKDGARLGLAETIGRRRSAPDGVQEGARRTRVAQRCAEAPSMQRRAAPGKKHQRGERGVRLVKWDHERPLGAGTHLRGVRSAHSLARPTPPTALKRRLERVHLRPYLTPRLPDLPPTPTRVLCVYMSSYAISHMFPPSYIFFIYFYMIFCLFIYFYLFVMLSM